MASYQKTPKYHETLPIYKTARQLATLVLLLPKDMRKDAKFLIGRELLREALTIMRLLRRMNIARGAAKVIHIDELLERLQFIDDLVTACDDALLIHEKQYASIIKITASIGEQAGKLKKTFQSV